MLLILTMLCVALTTIYAENFHQQMSDCKNGNCRLYEESSFRVQFLGGHRIGKPNDDMESEQMCYSYKLHQYRHKQRQRNNDTITWSLKLCPDENAYGKVSDYLSNVILDNNNFNTENDKNYYYIDEKRFYYVSSDHEKRDPIIELCFEPGHNNDDDFDIEELSIVTETEYCIQHSSNNKQLCSKRGVYVTDICGLQSIARQNSHLPAASIDYIPQPGQMYNIHKESRKTGLNNGHGFFTLHDSLVVLRAWWIDECRALKTGKDDKIIITINDDYFEHINSKYINNYDDLIDSPLALPIYDHFIIQTECSESIHGVIYAYQHDKINEKLHLYVDLSQSSLLMYFNEADFKLTDMTALDYTRDQNIYNNNNNNTNNIHNKNARRLARSRRFRKTVSLPLDDIDEDGPIYYKGRQIANVNAFQVTPFFEIRIGFHIRYRVDTGKQKLYVIEGSVRLYAGVDVYIEIAFGELSDDGMVEQELFSKTFKKTKFRSTIGPIVITTQPKIEVAGVLQRPAMGVTLIAAGEISGSVKAYGGWANKEGVYGKFDNSLVADYAFIPEYPGKDGRLEAQIALVVTPKLTFGLYGADILTVGVPFELPQASVVVSLDQSGCSGSSWKFVMKASAYLTATITVEIEKIRLFGFTVFNGYEWTPDEEIIKIKLWSWSYDDDSCKDESDIAPTTQLFSGITSFDAFENYTNLQEPYIMYRASFDSLSWGDANAVCSVRHGTQLATLNSQETYDAYLDMLTSGHWTPTNWQTRSWLSDSRDYPGVAWIGLYDFDDSDDVWKWYKDDSQWDESYFGWSTLSSIYGGDCGAYWARSSFYSEGMVDYDCDATELNWFACDLENIHEYNNKYIGVFIYSDKFTWSEANDYCNETFGTELATILTSTDNENAYSTIESIRSRDLSYPVDIAWIGIINVTNETDFMFLDGRNSRDSSDPGYNNWRTDKGEPNNLDSQKCTTFGDGSGITNGWYTKSCDMTTDIFVCNRPIVYEYHEYGDFLGVESAFSVSWTDANQICIDEFDTTLASVHSSHERDEIWHITHILFNWNDTITETANRYAWIGFTDAQVEDSFKWIDGTIDNGYENWDGGEPNNNGGNQDCAMLELDKNNVWNDDDCSNLKYRFICNRPQTELYYSNFIGINTHNEDITYTFDEAELYCNTHYGTNLASVQSSDENDVLAYVANEIGSPDEGAWIGVYFASNHIYTWTDGSIATYTNWDPDITSHPYNPCGLSQWSFSQKDLNTYWNVLTCDSETTAFICNRPVWEIESYGYIGVNLLNNKGEESVVLLTWDECEEYCQENYGTNLASILFESQRDEILQIYDAFGGNYNGFDMAIGGNDLNEEGTWVWNDGNEFDYNDWYPGQPNNGGPEHCLEIKSGSTYLGQWNDKECNEAKYQAFVCNRPPFVYPNGDYVLLQFWNNDRDFTWNDANIYCQLNFEGESLATHVDNQENFELQLEMILDNSDSYQFQGWIGGYRSSSSGTFIWQDDDQSVDLSSDYWISGQPNNAGGDQDCIEWRYIVDRDEYHAWSDWNCDDKMSAFFCNSPYYTYRYGDYIAVLDKTGNLRKSWSASYDYCQSQFGTSMAHIHNQEEQNDIDYIMKTLDDIAGYSVSAHIGLYDPDQDNENWIWYMDDYNDGILNQTIANWKPGEPDEYSHYCACIRYHYGHETAYWYDRSCSTSREVVICNA